VGAGVRPGQYGDVNMVDVAPTLAAMLGANVPASSQGRVRTEMLEIGQERMEIIRGALTEQQSQLVDLYQTAIGRRVAVEPGDDPVAAHQAAMDAALSARLNAERLPRAILALVIALVPAVVMFRWRGRDLAWLLGGAVLYQVLFNLRYAVLDRLTYSLSSVVGVNEFILYCAITAMIALVASWLVSAWGGKVFRREPRQAGEFTFGLVFVTIYLLSLPVLWNFALNGARITWALPDMGSLFLGFIALIQILLVAVLGLVLAGVTGLVARLGARGK